MLTLTAALLPVAFVPAEVIPSAPGFAPVLAALAIYQASRHHAFRRVASSGVDQALMFLLLWEVVRLLPLAWASAEQIDLSLLAREVLAVWAGIALFRMAQLPGSMRPVVRGLQVGFALMVAVAAYQMIVGASALFATGYTADSGYVFATDDGTMRPFGFFRGAAIFGTYFAVVAIAVVGLTKRPSRRIAALAAAIVVLVMSQTRGAILAVVGALATLLVLAPSQVRRRLAPLAALSLLVGAVVTLADPGVLSGVQSRFATVGEDASSTSRTEVWSGILHAVSAGHIFDGYGATEFGTVLAPYVPATYLGIGSAHSNYFYMLLTYGVVGLGAFLVLLSMLVRFCLQGLRNGGPAAAVSLCCVLAFAVASLVDNSLTSFNVLATVLLIAGLAKQGPQAAPAVAADLPDSRNRRPAGRVRT